MGIEDIQVGIDTAIGEVSEFVSEHPVISGIAIGGATAGVALGTVAIVRKAKKRKRNKNRNTRKKSNRNYKRKKGRKLKFGSKAYRKKYLHHKRHRQRKPYTARKRKDTSHKRIRYTKNNQPYIILASGKARFIKKSSARQSRKRKGGRY